MVVLASVLAVGASACGGDSSERAGQTSVSEPLVRHASGSCAAAIEFRGVTYLGTKLAIALPVGDVIGPGVELDCNAPEEPPVVVHELRDIDPAVAVATAGRPPDVIYVAEGACEGGDAQGRAYTPGEFLACLRN